MLIWVPPTSKSISFLIVYPDLLTWPFFFFCFFSTFFLHTTGSCDSPCPDHLASLLVFSTSSSLSGRVISLSAESAQVLPSIFLWLPSLCNIHFFLTCTTFLCLRAVNPVACKPPRDKDLTSGWALQRGFQG